jgi:transposase
MESPVDEKMVELTKLKSETASLRHTVAALCSDITNLLHRLSVKDKEYSEIKRENETLLAENRKINDKMALMKGGRDSQTSSTPPSQDIGRSNRQSLRTPSGKKSGGQPGHAGHHLQMTDTPDEIIDHMPRVCSCCGEHLEEVPGETYTCRQEVDIPPIRPFYTEHRSHIKTCPLCGRKNSGAFPDRLQGPVQYGPAVEAAAGYLSVFQYIPYNRISRFFKDFFKLPVSEGVIDGFLKKLSRKAASAYETIRERIQSSGVVGSDETGCRVNGKKYWFHVWQNRYLTFIVAFVRRSYEVTEKYFADGFRHTVYVSDCYASQLKTPAEKHQLCIAHLLRELLNFEKNLHSAWSIKMKKLLLQALELKKTMTGDDYRNQPAQTNDINNRSDELLTVDYSKFHDKEQALIKRLLKHRSSILTFLYYENVPPDNNASERSIRNVKVKTKVSGQFRNKDGEGADRYAKIRSVVDTTIKNGQDVYAALICMANCKI